MEYRHRTTNQRRNNHHRNRIEWNTKEKKQQDTSVRNGTRSKTSNNTIRIPN